MAAPNTSRFYPTPTSVTYYIGDLLIDDMFRVDFQRRVNHQPIWGYDSQKYDFIAQGKEFVSGNIVINYRYPGYLRAAIQRFAEEAKKNGTTVGALMNNEPQSTFSPTFYETLDSLVLQDKAKVISNELLKGKSNTPSSRASVYALVSTLKENMRKIYGANDTKAEEPDGSIDFYKSILDFPGLYPFDLTVRYGFQNVTGGYIRRFKDCIIIGESETVSASAGVGNDLSSSAQPILEVYSFFAKTIEVRKSN